MEVDKQREVQHMSQSEIARLRRQIQDEYVAAHRGLHEYATVAKHEIITNRFNQAGQYTDQLAQLVGEEEALHISTQIYIQVSEEETIQEEHPVVCSQGQDPTLQDPKAKRNTITIKAHLKWEGAQFLRDHGCHIEHAATGDVITFPARSRKAQLTDISRHCNTITLPDATEILCVDEDTTVVLLLIDFLNQTTAQLTL
jgi:hypothetical protein